MNAKWETHVGVQPETKRPFRLWNPREGKSLIGCNYKHIRRAHIGAMIAIRWAKVGDVIEVLDVATARLVGQYKRGVNDIKFLKGD